MIPFRIHFDFYELGVTHIDPPNRNWIYKGALWHTPCHWHYQKPNWLFTSRWYPWDWLNNYSAHVHSNAGTCVSVFQAISVFGSTGNMGFADTNKNMESEKGNTACLWYVHRCVMRQVGTIWYTFVIFYCLAPGHKCFFILFHLRNEAFYLYHIVPRVLCFWHYIFQGFLLLWINKSFDILFQLLQVWLRAAQRLHWHLAACWLV